MPCRAKRWGGGGHGGVSLGLSRTWAWAVGLPSSPDGGSVWYLGWRLGLGTHRVSLLTIRGAHLRAPFGDSRLRTLKNPKMQTLAVKLARHAIGANPLVYCVCVIRSNESVQSRENLVPSTWLEMP